MILGHLTWPEVDSMDRDVVVIIPTGSLEQHGPHLPLLTDTMLASAVAEEVERRSSGDCLLTPALWLGASGHHLPFAGTLSATFPGYVDALTRTIEGLANQGFHRFFVVNGHGGNSEPNGVALRALKEARPNLTLVHCGYFEFLKTEAELVLEGPSKEMHHACEAETSLMLHLHPGLVKLDRAVDDGLEPSPKIVGLVSSWDQVSGQGAMGYPSFARAATGKRLFEAAVGGVVAQVSALRTGIVYVGFPSGS